MSNIQGNNEMTVKELCRYIRMKRRNGTVTVDDWRTLAKADPEVACAELSGFLESYATEAAGSPYDRSNARSIAAPAGFVIGLVLTILTWLFMPDLRSVLIDDIPGFGDLATALMFASSFFPIVLSYIGARWSQAGRPSRKQPKVRKNGNFDEMLQQFESIQRELRRA